MSISKRGIADLLSGGTNSFSNIPLPVASGATSYNQPIPSLNTSSFDSSLRSIEQSFVRISQRSSQSLNSIATDFQRATVAADAFAKSLATIADRQAQVQSSKVVQQNQQAIPQKHDAGDRLADSSLEIAASAIHSGLPGAIAAGATAALTGFGRIGTLVAGSLIDPIIAGIREKQHEFASAGEAFSRSILGISAVLQSTSTVISASGLPSTNIQASIRFQERQAEQIQLAARSRLLPLGIAGATESTFVQGITSALGQRGIQANAEQIAGIAERIGGVIRATRPQLLENPALLNRDLQDVLSGLPQAQRTVLGSLLRQSLPQIASARTGGDILKSLDKIAPFADTVKNSDNIAAILDRLEGQKELLNTTAGNALTDAIKPGLKNFESALNGPEVEKSFATLGSAIGSLSKVGLDASAGVARISAALVNTAEPAIRFAEAISPLGLALIGAALSIVSASKIANEARTLQAVSAVSSTGTLSLESAAAVAALGSSATAFQARLAAGAASGGRLAAIGSLGSKAAGFARKLGPAAIVAGLGAASLNEAIPSLEDSRAASVDRSNQPILDAISQIQASRSVGSTQSRIVSLLNGAGLSDQLGKLSTERNDNPQSGINALNLITAAFGKSREFTGQAADIESLRQSAIGKRFESESASFGNSTAGGIFRERSFRGTLDEQTSSARAEREALDRQEAERLKSAKSIDDQIKSVDKDLDRARRFARVNRTFAGFAESGQANTSEFLGSAFGILSPDQATRVNNERFSEALTSNANIKSLEGKKNELTAQKSVGDSDVLQAAENRLAVERKIFEYSNQRLQSAQKESELFNTLADRAKSGFLTDTTGGAKAATANIAEFLGSSLKAGKEVLSGLQDQLKSLASQKLALQNESQSTSDPGLRKRDQEEIRRLEALSQSKSLELRSAQFDINRTSFGISRNEVAAGESQLGVRFVWIERKAFGMDECTFGRFEYAVILASIDRRTHRNSFAKNGTAVRNLDRSAVLIVQNICGFRHLKNG